MVKVRLAVVVVLGAVAEVVVVVEGAQGLTSVRCCRLWTAGWTGARWCPTVPVRGRRLRQWYRRLLPRARTTRYGRRCGSCSPSSARRTAGAAGTHPVPGHRTDEATAVVPVVAVAMSACPCLAVCCSRALQRRFVRVGRNRRRRRCLGARTRRSERCGRRRILGSEARPRRSTRHSCEYGSGPPRRCDHRRPPRWRLWQHRRWLRRLQSRLCRVVVRSSSNRSRSSSDSNGNSSRRYSMPCPRLTRWSWQCLAERQAANNVWGREGYGIAFVGIR